MRRLAYLLVLALGLAAPAASAQPRGAPTAAQPNKRERIKKRIRALRAYTLTEELALDEATAGKLFPILSKYDDDVDRLLQQRADLQQRLDGAPALKDPKTIDKLIDEAVANQRAFWDLEDKRLAELRRILTPAQTARLLVVLPALERKIQNQLRNAIQKARAAPGRSDADDAPDDPPARPRRRAPDAPPDCDPFTDTRGCRK